MYMLSINMKDKRLYFLWIILLCGIIQGQNRKLQHRPYADQRLFHLGFTVGFQTQDLILTQSGIIQSNGETWFSEIPNYSPGFMAGIIGDFYLTSWLNLRLIPSLYLGEKKIAFREQTTGEEYHISLRNNYFSLPILLKINTGRINNYRPYLLAGGYGSIELSSAQNLAVRLLPYDAGVELGVGCDFYLPFFNLSPELKFSFGLLNILDKDRDDLKDETLVKYASSLSGATTRMITLCFHFE